MTEKTLHAKPMDTDSSAVKAKGQADRVEYRWTKEVGNGGHLQ